MCAVKILSMKSKCMVTRQTTGTSLGMGLAIMLFKLPISYRIAGYFQGGKFSQIGPV